MASTFKFKSQVLNNQKKKIRGEVREAMETAMNDNVDDLARTASDSTPVDKGILQKAWTKEVDWNSNGQLEGTVSFAVREDASNGNYNYAVAMHEKDYKLGKKSKAKGGGTGMSGATYDVGKHYLTRPFEGESETYRNHIEKSIKSELRRLK